MNLQFCSRENQLQQLLQQNEKPTSIVHNILHCLVILPAGQLVAGRQKCQPNKCLSHTVKPVKWSTFGLWLTAQSNAMRT